MITVTCLKTETIGWSTFRNAPDHAFPECGTISPGMVKRLVNYASRCLTEYGFGPVLVDCHIEVETMQGDMPQSERTYHVTFTNPHGGSLGVNGIQTNKGWPCIDHGFFIDRN